MNPSPNPNPNPDPDQVPVVRPRQRPVTQPGPQPVTPDVPVPAPSPSPTVSVPLRPRMRSVGGAPVPELASAASSGVPSLASIVGDLAELKNLREEDARARFYVVHVAESGEGRCHELNGVDELIAFVRPLVGAQGQVFMFRGHRWHLTSGALKFLVPPAPASRIPLFDDPDEIPVDDMGRTDLDFQEDRLPDESTAPSPEQAGA